MFARGQELLVHKPVKLYSFLQNVCVSVLVLKEQCPWLMICHTTSSSCMAKGEMLNLVKLLISYPVTRTICRNLVKFRINSRQLLTDSLRGLAGLSSDLGQSLVTLDSRGFTEGLG